MDIADLPTIGIPAKKEAVREAGGNSFLAAGAEGVEERRRIDLGLVPRLNPGGDRERYHDELSEMGAASWCVRVKRGL